MSLAVLGMAAAPGVSYAAEALGASTLHVAVKPGTGSAKTHFVIDFRAGEKTGTFGTSVRYYRVTASLRAGSGCQSSVTTRAPASNAGANERVVLSPGGSRSWCAGTFSGQVWEVTTMTCGPPVDAVCPDFVIAPRLVGTFRFRVTRG